MKKVVLLNPPANKLYMRDYYCSKLAKANYYTPPIDLLIQSAVLKQNYEIFVIDAVVTKLKEEEVIKQIEEIKPVAVIFITGAVSWKEDFDFISRLSERVESKYIGSGDILMEEGEYFMEHYPFLYGIMLDFTNQTTSYLIEEKFDKVDNFIFRLNGKLVHKEKLAFGTYELPIPLHEKFPLKYYKLPYLMYHPFAVVLTDFGCPYNCKFCIMGTLGFKYRPVENVLEELDYIKSLKIKEIFFIDQTFTAHRKRIVNLCNQMIRKKYKFVWSCWTRVDLVDDDLLGLMKRAGCHLIQFGIETVSNETLDRVDKKLHIEQIKEAFKLCKKHKIKTLGTFIIGLEGETREDVLKSIEFAKKLDCDYVSFNTLVPRSRTIVRKKATEKGKLKDKWTILDQTGERTTVGIGSLTAQEVAELRKLAIKSFYFRPSYIIKSFFKVKTPYQLWCQIRDGFTIAKNLFFPNSSIK